MPSLAPDCDPTALDLSPAEGFLLSRIDGATPLSALREIAGMPREDVDVCIERWLKNGVVVIAAAKSGGVPVVRSKPRNAPDGPAEDVFAADANIEMDLESQRAILDFADRLDRPYHEILGVPRDADARAVKRAYFALSKCYHPDRYFRRRIGPYKDLLERVFRKIVEAYELLSDPTARAEIEKSLGSAGGRAEAASGAGGKPRRGPKPFSVIHRVMGQRKAKARTFFEAGMAAFSEGRWLEAASSVRLAIAFDPWNENYKERFGEVQRRAHEVRAEQLLREAESAMSFRDHRDAADIFEEALHYRPHDPELNHKVAKLAWMVKNDLRAAKEYALAACELDPDVGLYHRTLGQVYRAAGLTANARRELKAAIKLDPTDLEAKSELKSLGRA